MDHRRRKSLKPDDIIAIALVAAVFVGVLAIVGAAIAVGQITPR
jgi:hypothetical protein